MDSETENPLYTFCFAEMRDNLDVTFTTGKIDEEDVQFADYTVKKDATPFWKQLPTFKVSIEDVLRQALLRRAKNKGFTITEGREDILANEIFTKFRKEKLPKES